MAACGNFVAVLLCTFSLFLVVQAHNGHWLNLEYAKNQADKPNYKIGVGRADVTGPAAEIGMMGYAKQGQNTNGIHLRLFSRAFIVADPDEDTSRTVFVSVDCAMVGDLMKTYVVNKLKNIYGDKCVYNERNVCLSATHTHSGPAGYLQYVLYNVPNLGFLHQSFDALVDGIVASIQRAHKNIVRGDIYLNQGELLDANINRSPTSYLSNPDSERARYEHNTDTNMVVLKFVDESGTGLGMISWFAVHGTSMNNTNHLISGDNKGYASQLFEADMNPDSLAGQGAFVAAFAQSNEGDVSPNTKGPRCQDTGLECDLEHSTCDGRVQMCIASGPGKDMFDSTRIIGEKQYNKAKALYNADTQVKLSGPVNFALQFVDMTKVTVKYSSHSYTIPYDWQPAIVDIQVFMWGPLVIAAVPGEFSTMSGRRLRDSVKTALASKGLHNGTEVVVAGLSNTYSSYIATYEEYQKQRYEAASTLYGPDTLAAYQQLFGQLAEDMVTGAAINEGPHPPDLLDDQISFIPGVVYDHAAGGHDFGDVVQDAASSYIIGDTVTVCFISAHPRNDLRTQPEQMKKIVGQRKGLFDFLFWVLKKVKNSFFDPEEQVEGTFLTVERMKDDGTYEVVHNDASWDTVFKWKRTNTILGESEATITWNIGPGTKPGTYRIRHFGQYKHILAGYGGILPFTGCSREFKVNP